MKYLLTRVESLKIQRDILLGTIAYSQKRVLELDSEILHEEKRAKEKK